MELLVVSQVFFYHKLVLSSIVCADDLSSLRFNKVWFLGLVLQKLLMLVEVLSPSMKSYVVIAFVCS